MEAAAAAAATVAPSLQIVTAAVHEAMQAAATAEEAAAAAVAMAEAVQAEAAAEASAPLHAARTAYQDHVRAIEVRAMVRRALSRCVACHEESSQEGAAPSAHWEAQLPLGLDDTMPRPSPPPIQHVAPHSSFGRSSAGAHFPAAGEGDSR